MVWRRICIDGCGETKEEKIKKQFKGQYNSCGQIGHKSVDYWEKEANKDKRPSNWLPKKKINDTSKVNCYNCNKMEHYTSNCPLKKNSTPSTSYYDSVMHCKCFSMKEEQCKVVLKQKNNATTITNTTRTKNDNKKYLRKASASKKGQATIQDWIWTSNIQELIKEKGTVHE